LQAVKKVEKLALLTTPEDKSKGGFTQNPVTAYDPAYGQRQSSHRLRCPYPGNFSRFRSAFLERYEKR